MGSLARFMLGQKSKWMAVSSETPHLGYFRAVQMQNDFRTNGILFILQIFHEYQRNHLFLQGR